MREIGSSGDGCGSGKGRYRPRPGSAAAGGGISVSVETEPGDCTRALLAVAYATGDFQNGTSRIADIICLPFLFLKNKQKGRGRGV